MSTRLWALGPGGFSGESDPLAEHGGQHQLLADETAI